MNSSLLEYEVRNSSSKYCFHLRKCIVHICPMGSLPPYIKGSDLVLTLRSNWMQADTSRCAERRLVFGFATQRRAGGAGPPDLGLLPLQ